MKSLSFNVYGIRAKINCADQLFLNYIQKNYSPFVVNDNDFLNIEIFFSPNDGNIARSKTHDMLRVGKGIYFTENSIYWENDYGFSFFLSFLSPDRWIIRSFHFNLSQILSEGNRYMNYMRSMRWVLHFPIFCFLEKFKSISLIHASAVSKNGTGVIFGGLNKVGKSSLARYLYDHHQFDFVCDNFLLTDHNRLYPFPEMFRLSSESLTNLSLSVDNKVQIYGKFHIPVPLERIATSVKPCYIFLVTNSSKFFIKPITLSYFSAVLGGMHDYLGEFPQYTFYSLLSSTAFDYKPSVLPSYSNTNTKAFLMSMPFDWNFDYTTSEVLRYVR